MKIVLENGDSIEFKQVSKLVDKALKAYATDYTCSIRNSDGETLENMNAELLFGNICDEKNVNMQREITDYISSIFGFDSFKTTEQSDIINVETDKSGILLDINGAKCRPNELKDIAHEYRKEIGITFVD